MTLARDPKILEAAIRDVIARKRARPVKFNPPDLSDPPFALPADAENTERASS